MAENFKYEIDEELKLTVEHFDGLVNLANMKKYKFIEIEDENYIPNYNMINDFRDCDLRFSEEDILEYIEFVKENARVGGKRRNALLTDTPQHTVASMIFQMASRELPQTIEIFTTLEAAMRWLGYSGNDLLTVEETIKDLKTPKVNS